VSTDVLTVAQTLSKHYGIEVPLKVTGNYRLGDIRHNYADISLAKQVLGFKPKWTFDAGIKQFTEWVNRQELQTDNYEASLEEMKQKGLFK
jgi:dTDP-L-rhamnose 4-epimerase